MRKIILFVFVILCAFKSNSQIYYGAKDFGKIEFINDSIVNITFTSSASDKQTESCFYKKNHDTIFLSSIIKKPYEIEILDSNINIGKGYPIVIKFYYKERNDYRLENEEAYVYDTINDQIVLNDYTLYWSRIIVYKSLYYNRIFIPYESSFSYIRKNITIKNIKYGWQTYFFEDFPLLIKGKKLIPLDKDKNFQCWIENGFYFPVMMKSDKNKNYRTIGLWSKGLRGLPSGFEIK